MTFAPRFEIVRFVAHYNCYDSIVGWSGSRVAVANTKGWAFVLASREGDDYDVRTEVREIATGKRVWNRTTPAIVDTYSFDAIPF